MHQILSFGDEGDLYAEVREIGSFRSKFVVRNTDK